MKTSVENILKRDFAMTIETPCECGNANCDGEWVVLPSGVMRCPAADDKRSAEKFERSMQASGIGAHHDIDWADVDTAGVMGNILTACSDIAPLIKHGNNLVFWGEAGTGKTQAAVLIAKAAMKAGFAALLQNLSRVAINIRAGYNSRDDMPTEADVVRELAGVDVLWLDDLGAAETTTRSVEGRILYHVLDERYNANKFTGVTTNLSMAALETAIGTRAFQRLTPYEPVVFDGKNYRKEKRRGASWNLG